MSLQYQLCLQMDEMQLQLNLLSSELTEMKRQNHELNTEKLNWERKSKTLEEENKALTQKTEKLEALNKVLREILTTEAQHNNNNVTESVGNLPKRPNVLEPEVSTNSFKMNIKAQQDQSRKLKSSLLEMLSGFTNFASDMRKRQQNLSIIGTNNIEDTLIQEFVTWATQQTERLCDRSIAELTKIADYPNFPRWSTVQLQ
ncbi:unnamed protein product [Caenorhabditis nigoni]